MRTSTTKTTEKPVRCAIYTRKSTEEGLAQEFNSLDAQRESAEAYIASQKGDGWICLPDRYDDGGFTGGNLERPAVQRLLRDIEAGKVDCVVVYKVDRLSRSLLDFARLMETFDKQKVLFVSVSQQFNTTHSMGRLTLNILLSFAQFEPEIISERTRDKMAAARRKGKFAGGRPVLGYDIQRTPAGPRLVINEDEASRVRGIFDLYLQHQALTPVVKELDRRGWTTKRRVARDGVGKGGNPFTKTDVFKLLTNVLYIGSVNYRGDIHPGEHAGIVAEETWQKVQAQLQHNGRTGGKDVRNRHGALLKGLLRCVPCDCSMGHTYSTQREKRYRYYVCLNAQKRGWHNCPSKSVPAGEMETFVVEQLRAIGRDPAVLATTLRAAQTLGHRSRAELQTELRALERDLTRHHAEYEKVVADPAGAATAAALRETIRTSERRATDIREEIAALDRGTVSDAEVRAALAAFDPVWETLSPRERARIVRLLVERVDYDGKAGTVAVTFRPSGIKSLTQSTDEAAA